MSEQSHRLKEEQFSLSGVYFPQIVTKLKIFLCFLHLSILSHFFFLNSLSSQNLFPQILGES